MASLEGWSSTIELRPQLSPSARCRTTGAERAADTGSVPSPGHPDTPHGAITIATGWPLIVVAVRAAWVRVSIGVTTPTWLIEPETVAALIT
jgi:hypothetical protein